MISNQDVRDQFKQLRDRNPLLARIVFEVDGFAQQEFRANIAITSIHRPNNLKSVHAYWRGVDIGLYSSRLKREQLEEVAEWINNGWSYSRTADKLVALFGKHDPGGRHNDHMHLQTSMATTKMIEVHPI
jgi:hypothetical protein